MNEELYNKINKLLSYLRGANAITLIHEFYRPFDNDAPGQLTKWAMDDLQEELDKFRSSQCE